MKERCNCGKMAVWLYMPSGGGNSPYYCDNCVPRGCSCQLKPKDGNWENSNEDNWVQPLDGKGRKFPCCEFDYSEEGFEI